MKAIVLAAGTGRRLRPITIVKPKCAVTVAGRSILEHQLRAYEASPITECIVVTGYKHDAVRKLCSNLGSHVDLDISITQNEIYANTDNLYSLYCAFNDHEFDEFVLSNGDVVFPPDTINHLFETDAENVIVCDLEAYSDESMKIETGENGEIRHISKDISESDAYATTTDLYRFGPDAASAFIEMVKSRVQQNAAYHLWVEEELNGLFDNEATRFFPVSIGDRPWAEIDDEDDLRTADELFRPPGDLGEKKAFFFDLDGTIYIDDELTPGAGELIRTVRRNDADVYFLSNNSSMDKETYVTKLTSMGVQVEADEVVLSTDGVIRYLTDNGVESTYVVGTEKLRAEFQRNGIDPKSDDPTHVIVGFDTELTYEKVRRATKAIQQGAKFLATHPDFACPSKGGMIPDAGAITALVEATIDRDVDRVFGKPQPEMIVHILEKQNLSLDEVIIVGDRLRTDIGLANEIGCDSVCVLTGDSDRYDIERNSEKPTMILPDVGSLRAFMD